MITLPIAWPPCVFGSISFPFTLLPGALQLFASYPSYGFSCLVFDTITYFRGVPPDGSDLSGK